MVDNIGNTSYTGIIQASTTPGSYYVHPEFSRTKTPEWYNEECVKKIIDKIKNVVSDQKCIFRGEPRMYRPPCSSQLYRQLEPVKDDKLIHEEQDKYVKWTKRYMRDTHNDIDRLTELQHFGGITNFIDFTQDYLIALFFACEGNLGKHGRLIIKNKDDYTEVSSYADIQKSFEKSMSIILHPLPTNNRVVRQASIFVTAQKGYIELIRKGKDWIQINKDDKIHVLIYLEKYHNITYNTVFDDLYGYIEQQKRTKMFERFFYQGVRFYEQQKYDEAIGYFDITTKLSPKFAPVYFYRGLAYYQQEAYPEYPKAIADWTKAIKFEPKHVNAYYNRGVAYAIQGNTDNAIADFTKVIELDPKKTEAYYNRGIAYREQKEFDKAIADFTKVIELEH